MSFMLADWFGVPADKSSQLSDTDRKRFAAEMAIALMKSLGGDDEEFDFDDSDEDWLLALVCWSRILANVKLCVDAFNFSKADGCESGAAYVESVKI